MDIKLGFIDQIPEGEGRTFETGAEPVAVFRTRDHRVFATQPECPHRGGPLAAGLLGGATLICPLHSMKFDLTTGEAASGECRLKTYPVKVDHRGLITVSLAKS